MSIDDTFAALKYRITEHNDRIEYRDTNGKRHREDGPAVIWYDGTREWWDNGSRHREDGPAIVFPNGNEVWFINGNKCTPRNKV